MDAMHHCIHRNRENARILLCHRRARERGERPIESLALPALAASSSVRPSADFTRSPPSSKRKGPLLWSGLNARDVRTDGRMDGRPDNTPVVVVVVVAVNKLVKIGPIRARDPRAGSDHIRSAADSHSLTTRDTGHGSGRVVSWHKQHLLAAGRRRGRVPTSPSYVARADRTYFHFSPVFAHGGDCIALNWSEGVKWNQRRGRRTGGRNLTCTFRRDITKG